MTSTLSLRMRAIQEKGEACVGCMASNTSKDCNRKPVAVVHHPPEMGWPPEKKCQYHLDVRMEFGPRPDRVEVL